MTRSDPPPFYLPLSEWDAVRYAFLAMGMQTWRGKIRHHEVLVNRCVKPASRRRRLRGLEHERERARRAWADLWI